jgi:hypothetical protein
MMVPTASSAGAHLRSKTATSWTIVAIPAAVNTGQICSRSFDADFAILPSP